MNNDKFLKKMGLFFRSLSPTITFDTLGSPSLQIELNKQIELDNKEIEERINQLDDVKNKLIKAADAITRISYESKHKKTELEVLKKKIEEINKDKEAIEKILEVDQESFSRLLVSTNKRTEKRSIWLGIIIGFVTGTISSLLVWWLTS